MRELPILILALWSIYIFARAIYFSKNNGFYKNTHVPNILGVYVWGDGLILGPFWFFSAVLMFFLSADWIVRYLLLFFILRSLIEIIFWINHQVAKKEYTPPLFSKITWLKSNESAILYQVMHTCIVTFLLFCFIYTFFI